MNNRTSPYCEHVVDRHGTGAALGQRLPVEVERIVKGQCRAAGNVGRGVGEGTERYLELLQARSDSHGHSSSDCRGVHINAGAARTCVAAAHRIVEADAVNRDGTVRENGARFTTDCVPENCRVPRTLLGSLISRRRPPTSLPGVPNWQQYPNRVNRRRSI